ncbi:MAG: peptide chain release factor N(5)-glutamine methyltransferase [Flavobacterium sp.]|nr:MAG: peptide chain release factor N(5)-glutamine methyltransferase [Flavobacterium sp.]
MKLREYRTGFIEKLSSIYGHAEAESFFNISLEEIHRLSRSSLALQPDFSISESELALWDSVLHKLKNEIPIQYIFGCADFFGMKFKVNENVLIPRQETEELVEWILTENKNKPGLSVIDVGTGSGCIAISLAKNLPEANVTAIDVSPDALSVARENASKNTAAVEFICQDVLSADRLPKADVIVSNPPYVTINEKQEMRRNVLENEPHLALFVPDNDALLFYRKIGGLALHSLRSGGVLYFEINQYLGDETVKLLNNIGFRKVELRKDIYGNDRMIRASL